MLERYLRSLGALSEPEISLLAVKRVFIAGCGGLGGYICDSLIRVGVGHIGIADGDCFEESNLNRQLFSHCGNIGASKAAAAADYASRVNPETELISHPLFITESNADSLISGSDCVIDALDNVLTRRMLKRACDRLRIPYIYGSVSLWSAQCALSMPGDGILDRLYPDDLCDNEKSILPFAASLCASMQAALCVSLLTGRSPESGKLYLFDLSDMDFHTIET